MQTATTDERRERELDLLGAALNLHDDAQAIGQRYAVNDAGGIACAEIAAAAGAIAQSADHGYYAAAGVPVIGVDVAEQRLADLRARLAGWR